MINNYHFVGRMSRYRAEPHHLFMTYWLSIMVNVLTSRKTHLD